VDKIGTDSKKEKAGRKEKGGKGSDCFRRGGKGGGFLGLGAASLFVRRREKGGVVRGGVVEKKNGEDENAVTEMKKKGVGASAVVRNLALRLWEQTSEREEDEHIPPRKGKGGKRFF